MPCILLLINETQQAFQELFKQQNTVMTSQRLNWLLFLPIYVANIHPCMDASE